MSHEGTQQGMPARHTALAVLVVAIWGTNFVVIHVGLAQFPPLTFAALRFAFASLPLVWFVPRPRAAFRSIATYGLLIGGGQTGLMLCAMDGHIAPGLASLIIQTQAFFTVGLAMIANRERPRVANLISLAFCAGGVALIGVNTGGDADALGITLVLSAAFAWAFGNIVAKNIATPNMLSLVVWSGLIVSVPLFCAALLFEGPALVAQSVTRANAAGWASLAWQSTGNAVFGYAVWNWLLTRHPAADVVPVGLLVPVFGMSAAALFLGEPLQAWKLLAAALVLTGLGVNLVAARRPAAIGR